MIEAYMMRGLILRQSSHPRPDEASFPEIKFSIKISDRSISRCNISSPAGDLKSTVMDRLLRFADRKYADSGGKWEASVGAQSSNGAAGGFQDPEGRCCEWGAMWNGRKTELVSSPRVISSTLITSAPRSASNIVAVGPASTRVRSMTLRPRKGGSMLSGSGADDCSW